MKKFHLFMLWEFVILSDHKPSQFLFNEHKPVPTMASGQIAFTSISHTKLLHKVECYGFSSSLVKWLSSFLTNRSQQVYIGQSLSSSLPVSSGVPQGSVLGPLLFLIYINDLPECLEPPFQAKIFADDTKLYATHSSNSSSPLTLSLLNFSVWSQTWQLNIAFQKCSVISFGHNSASHSYSLGACF